MTALQLWLVLICGGSAASFQNHATAPANSASAAGDSDAGHTSITTWEFELDPHDLGVREQWFSPQAKPALARNITSPGPWEAMGVGKMGDYSGVGWYRQQLVVPAIPANGSLWLWIGGAPGGVLRSANVYANAVHIGRHVGYVDPLEMELTPAVQPGGTLTLAVAIDSRWNRTEDPLWASGALGSCFTGGCGGMLGNAQLQIRQRAWIEDSVTTSCADTGNGSTWRCAVGFSLVGDMNTDDRIGLTICESGQQSGAGQGCVTSTPAAVRSTAGDRMTLSLAIPAAKLWNPGTQQAQANLYVANLTLVGSGGQSIATTMTRFGIRSISTDGPRIIWNGEPLFLRGYGDDAQYGFTGAPPMNKDYYMTQLVEMKSLGYNYIRFHTHQMPDVAHEAADELGFLTDPEFSMCSSYELSIPDNLPPATTEAMEDIFRRSFASIVNRRQHHPSLFGYILSNEISWGGPGDRMFVELYRYAKQHDPDRPCLWTEGAITLDIASMDIPALACRNGTNESDFHCFQDVYIPDSVWSHTGSDDGHTDVPMHDIISGVAVEELPVPMLLHEAFDSRTFPRLNESMQSYEGGLVDVGPTFLPSINKMRALGLYEENDRWADATEAAYTMYMKAYIENYRLDPAVSGYEWWLAWTYLGGSSGILAGNENKPTAKPGISNATIRCEKRHFLRHLYIKTNILPRQGRDKHRENSKKVPFSCRTLQQNVVLLVKDPVRLQTTGRYPGEFVPIEVQLSNWTFSGDPAWFGNAVQLSWTVSIPGGPQLDNGTSDINHLAVVQGTTGPIAVFGVETPAVSDATKILIEVTLQVGVDIIAANRWNLTVFPPVAPATACSVPVFVASEDLLGAAQVVCKNAAVAPSSLASQAGPFVLVVQENGLTEEDAATLARAGGMVLLLNPASGWPVCNHSALGQVTMGEVRFDQPWWMNPGMTGTLVYNTTLVQSMMGAAGVVRRYDHRHLDYSWANVVDRGQAYTLDHLDAGAARVVHIRAIPAFINLQLQTTVSNSALVWEGKIAARARFIVSGLNLNISSWESSAAAQQAEPAARFLFGKLVSYAVSEAAALVTNALVTNALAPQLDNNANDPPSFCTAGSEQACQQRKTVPGGVANRNFEIAMRVHLDHDAVVDAIHPRLSALGDSGGAGGVLIVPVVYATTSSPSPAKNTSAFCSQAPAGHVLPGSWQPQRLVAKGPATKFTAAANATVWARLPLMAPTPLTAGTYWIGFLSAGDLNCFADVTPPGGKAAPLDFYALRSFSSGPGLGPELSWVEGSSSVAIYASTKS